MFYSLFLDLSSLVSFCLPIRARARLFGFFSCPMLKRDSLAKETMQINFFPICEIVCSQAATGKESIR